MQRVKSFPQSSQLVALKQERSECKNLLCAYMKIVPSAQLTVQKEMGRRKKCIQYCRK